MSHDASDRPLRAVCFDWGGVILRICRSFEQGCRAAGLAVHGGAIDPGLRALRRGLTDRYQAGGLSDDEFFEAVSGAMGRAYTPAEVARLHDAWLLEEYPGMAGVMDGLNRAEGLTTAVLSNTNARHWARRLGDFPTCGRARVQLASHELRLAKPDPRIYAAAAGMIGVEPGSILFFDDLEENIQAARAAGWMARHIDHTADTAAQVIGALAEHGVELG